MPHLALDHGASVVVAPTDASDLSVDSSGGDSGWCCRSRCCLGQEWRRRGQRDVSRALKVPAHLVSLGMPLPASQRDCMPLRLMMMMVMCSTAGRVLERTTYPAVGMDSLAGRASGLGKPFMR